MESRPRSRRSNLNLAGLSIAPLSRDPTYPSSYDEQPDASPSYHRSSYIHDRSAPTTPGILSRSSSLSRTSRSGTSRSYTHLAFANTGDPSALVADDPAATPTVRTGKGHLPKAKSTTILYPPGIEPLLPATPTHSDAARKKAGKPHRKTKSTTTADDSLIFRLGSAIASSNREQKGQSWLASRASTTSLVGLDDHVVEERVDRGRVDYRDYAQPSSRISSRPQSRSRMELAGFTPYGAGARTPKGPRTPRRSAEFTFPTSGEKEMSDYFGSSAHLSAHAVELSEGLTMRGIPGPDFVDPRDKAELEAEEESRGRSLSRHELVVESSDDEDESREDDEVARLARGQTFGFGGFIDRLVGWSFETITEEEEDDIYEARKMEAERRRKARGASDVAPSTMKSPIALNEKTSGGSATADSKEQGGWSDAAWLLSVASKALFQQ